MNCPKCSAALESLEIEGVDLHLCPNCKGIWFDRDELAYYLTLHEDIPDLNKVLPEAHPTSHPCPRCGNQLEEMRFSASDDLLIDRCPKCRGIWFDENELGKAKEIAAGREENESKINAVMKSFDEQVKISFSSSPEIRYRRYFSIFMLSPLLLTFGYIFITLLTGSISRTRTHAPQTNPNSANMLNSLFRQDPNGNETRRIPGRPFCPTCRGKGKLVTYCPDCDGTGRQIQLGTNAVYRKILCDECRGTGRRSGVLQIVKCASCDGSGWMITSEKICPRCKGVGQIKDASGWMDCPECDGAGTIPPDMKLCRECLGTGEIETGSDEVCKKCYGLGTRIVVQSGGIACNRCSGTGILSETTCPTCNGVGRI